MKNTYKISAFTLIEILVSLTIFSIMMVSVMMIFINSINVSQKSEINRVMQENIKNIVETISEDVRKNGIVGVSVDSLNPTCDFNVNTGNHYKKGTKLCTNTSPINEYYLARDNGTNLNRVDSSLCGDIGEHCVIVKNGDPISNSHVSIKDLNYYISNDNVPKVTISMVMQPAAGKGVKSNLIKENKIIFETTISTRSF